MAPRTCLPLESASLLPAAAIGGKTRNVLKLAAIPGVRIPASWVLTTVALRRFTTHAASRRTLASLARAYLAGDRSPLFAALAHAPFPGELEREIASTISLRRRRLLIVRSSGTQEDAAGTSLAGHYESVVAQSAEASLLFAIKACWMVGLRVYLDQLHIPGSRTAPRALDRALDSLALLIQEVVPAERSGVYFSRSPLHPDRAMVVAAYGTCHSVVDGKLASDTYVLHPDGTLDSANLAHKFEMTIVSSDDDPPLPGQTVNTPVGPTHVHFPYGEGLWTARVPPALASEPVLDDRALQEIHDTAERLRRELGYDLDMEWSFAGGELVVLQVRPITTETAAQIDLGADAEYGIASPGIASGPIKIVRSPGDLAKIEPGDLMAVASTDPDYMPIFHRIAGIVCEDGSPLSHTAIVARELGLPCLIGVHGATKGVFADGERIVIDARRGQLRRGRGSRRSAKQRPPLPRRRRPLASVEQISQLERAAHVEILFSALAIGYMSANDGRSPTRDSLDAYAQALVRRHGLERLTVRWDINDLDRTALELDPELEQIAKLAQKGWP